MFGVIGAAAIYGAIGGFIGALAGMTLSLPFRTTNFSKFISTAMIIAGAIIGANIAEPLLQPILGEALRPKLSSAQLEETISGMREDPLIDAVFVREPALVDVARQELAEGFAAGGRKGLESAATQLGFQLGTQYVPKFYTRGRDQDLVGAFTAFAEVGALLKENDPETCYAWLFSGFGHAALDFSAYQRAVGELNHDALQAAMAMVVKNAFDEVPAYDVEAAAASVDVAGAKMQDLLGAENIDLITGVRAPADKSEKALACASVVALYDSLLADPAPGPALRHLFILSSGG